MEDAFPKIEIHNHMEKKEIPEGKSSPSREERRAARKKAKRCKGPAAEYLAAQDGETTVTDPDRQAVKRLGDVPAFVSYADAFPDISGVYEGFKLPKLPTANCLITDQGLPAYFGKGIDDEEGFANYSGTAGDNPGYRLIPNTVAGFEEKGASSSSNGAGVSALPAPSIVNSWKPMTAAKTTTAFTNSHNVERVEPEIPESKIQDVAPPKVEKPAPVASRIGRESGPEAIGSETLLTRIHELSKRLEDLERREPPRNTQKELLVFVGAGLFLLLSFDLAMRAGRR